MLQSTASQDARQMARAVKASPADATLRRIYADALLDAGRHRAAEPPSSPRRSRRSGGVPSLRGVCAASPLWEWAAVVVNFWLALMLGRL